MEGIDGRGGSVTIVAVRGKAVAARDQRLLQRQNVLAIIAGAQRTREENRRLCGFRDGVAARQANDRVYAGNAVHGEAVVLLEAANSVVGLLAEYTVRRYVVAEVGQPGLQQRDIAAAGALLQFAGDGSAGVDVFRRGAGAAAGTGGRPCRARGRDGGRRGCA